MTPVMEERPYTHETVLLDETVTMVVTDPDGTYLDATVGLGGHSEAILKRISARGQLIGTDMDPEALQKASLRLKPLGRYRLIHENFRNLGQLLSNEKIAPLSGAIFDLGVSSMQLDKAARGFSFMDEGPLDMRMDPANPLTAARIVNEWPAEQIALLLSEFGEEREAKRIALAIVARRSTQPFQTTTDLANFISEKFRRQSGGIHPATRTFQALRIAVNRELENLSRGLEAVLPHIRPGGRMAVITFHSLEDRIVKNIFRSFEEQGLCRLITPSPVLPTSREVERNPRSRSAKLRGVEKR